MKERMIESLAREALDVGLDAMCAYVQDELGVNDGGVAGIVFTAHPTIDAMRTLLIEYIIIEMENKE